MSDRPDQDHSVPDPPARTDEPTIGRVEPDESGARRSGPPTSPPFAHGATSPTDTTETAPLDLPAPQQVPASDPAMVDPEQPGTDSAPTVALPLSGDRSAPAPALGTATAAPAVGTATAVLPTGDVAGPTDVHSGADGDSDSGDDAANDSAKLRVPRDPKSRLALVTLLFAIVAFGLNLLSVTNATRLSALDEATHVDYAWRISHGELTYPGQELSRYTLDSWACRGQANISNMPECGSGAPATDFPVDGIQYNANHPPTYYAITGLGARLLAAISGQDFITMARVIGGIWLFLGMLAFYLALRYWRVGWGWATGGALMLPLIPVLLHATTIVSNDAAVPLAGVAALFVLGRHVIYRNYGWILPVLFTVAVTATKTISAVALGAVGVVLVVLGIVRWRTENPRAGMTLIRNGLLMGIALAVVHFGWQAIQNSRAPAGYVSPVLGVNNKRIDGLPFDEWIPTLFSGARLGDNFYLDPHVNNPWLQGWVALITAVLAAAGLVGLAAFRRGEPRWIAAGTLVIGVLFYPLAVQSQTLLRDYFFPEITTRYGMSLLPLAVGVVVMVAEHKRLRITSWVLLLAGGVAVGSASMSVWQ